ncbi:glutaredoxin 2 [Amaricoccus macauensis]|uniref:glutaredoxin 2 n=1 Tax=Amaricoccus macauensis TaxID=57001 RepID=UPI003C7BFEDB
MKLYVYDHCPFCVRARMPFGLKDIPFELCFQANDDEETPISMIGAKMLPILEDADGFMGESLDIVHKVDGLKGTRLFDGEPRQDLRDWLSQWNSTVNGLVIPRTPDPVFPEFRTASARAYFTRKKEADFGRFDDLIAETDRLTAEMETGLAELAPILPDPEGASIEDILLFPILRSLSIVPQLNLPAEVAAYRDRMSERTGIPLVEALRIAAE